MNKMKDRWDRARRYSEILGISKEVIFNNYLDICERYEEYLASGKVHLFKKGCYEEINFKARFETEKQLALGIKKDPINKEPKVFDPEEKDEFSDIKLMFWVIKKMGGVERVQKVLDVAKVAMEAME